jgi:hypothetical protein
VDRQPERTAHAGHLKKPYKKPAFRHERVVFETLALACGKVSATQGSCRFNLKKS